MNLNKQKIGRVLGPIMFIIILQFFHPEGLSETANAVLASAVWIAICWITEALPIAVTALLPVILFPLSGGLSLKETTASYGHKYISLFIGGFILAIALEKRIFISVLH
jgi:sodium-dependent dicarboxylate transporter 2/3/5